MYSRESERNAEFLPIRSHAVVVCVGGMVLDASSSSCSCCANRCWCCCPQITSSCKLRQGSPSTRRVSQKSTERERIQWAFCRIDSLSVLFVDWLWRETSLHIPGRHRSRQYLLTRWQLRRSYIVRWRRISSIISGMPNIVIRGPL